MADTIHIANAGGYWGDDLSQFRRQVELGPVDYVTLDFLAEITMSIMQKQRAQLHGKSIEVAAVVGDDLEVRAPQALLAAAERGDAEDGVPKLASTPGAKPRARSARAPRPRRRVAARR